MYESGKFLQIIHQLLGKPVPFRWKHRWIASYCETIWEAKCDEKWGFHIGNARSCFFTSASKLTWNPTVEFWRRLKNDRASPNVKPQNPTHPSEVGTHAWKHFWYRQPCPRILVRARSQPLQRRLQRFLGQIKHSRLVNLWTSLCAMGAFDSWGRPTEWVANRGRWMGDVIPTMTEPSKGQKSHDLASGYPHAQIEHGQSETQDLNHSTTCAQPSALVSHLDVLGCGIRVDVPLRSSSSSSTGDASCRQPSRERMTEYTWIYCSLLCLMSSRCHGER